MIFRYLEIFFNWFSGDWWRPIQDPESKFWACYNEERRWKYPYPIYELSREEAIERCNGFNWGRMLPP